MAWLSALKQYFFRSSLKREAATLKRSGEVKNYANSRYIGIWFDATNRSEFDTVDAFARKLVAKGKKVELLAYVGKVKKEEDIPFEHLEPSEISWAGVPNSNTVKLWAQKPYDLLLCLHPQSCQPLEYLATLSQAKCRVGRYADDTVDCYDIMVSLSENPELPRMIKQVDQLLTEINKNLQQNAA